MNHPDSALMHIVEADLPPATERVALRLAALADWTPSGHGLLVFSWDDFCTLCNRPSRASARRHLSMLTKAALLHYSTDGDDIYLTWICRVGAPPQSIPHTVTVDSAHQIEHHECDDRETAKPNGCDQRTAAVAPAHRQRRLRTPSSHTRGLVGGGGTIFSHPREDPSTTTHHPPAVSQQLRALGLRPDSVPIHRDLCPDDVRRILDAWQQDAAAQEVGPGALLYRLRHGLTPVDPAAIRPRESERSKYEIPEEYAGIIIG